MKSAGKRGINVLLPMNSIDRSPYNVVDYISLSLKNHQLTLSIKKGEKKPFLGLKS